MSFESSVPEVRLNNDVRIPQLGFGVFKVPEQETATAVTAALESGYRSIDTAAVYGNEAAVGAALAESDVPRDEIFVTTKLWNDAQGYDAALTGFDESLARLGLDYVDLYLIHWPAPARDLYLDTWRAFEKLYADERVRAIGVSNFQPAHLRRLLEHTGVVPVLNQIELHPYLQQEELRALHAEHGIATEAWSPIARGGALLQDPVITSIAARHGRTPAQVVLRWHIHLGNIVIPKSVTPSRVKENIDIFDFSLTPEDLAAISTLDNGTRTGPDPDTFN
ncbi:oxidoreductase [Sphaerisporangium krabiense]|uniref:Diketogulonate reductase-like aldo/keto reductase n=1 Tax=Sphaerisporangium krabiense TaxID=763782 RepID=A0A7W9DS03_9ACTN|nr:aldo/keto reductase [Sphaerisporangium krabiense]MBB5629018.1 diketogulonate reductase-like aldo/keto reductase [Sphaerisporangium krabiense]GII60142.1 oxidoreductase [Sphaerisporangium krabiense]